jgi:hypothetical protein
MSPLKRRTFTTNLFGFEGSSSVEYFMNRRVLFSRFKVNFDPKKEGLPRNWKSKSTDGDDLTFRDHAPDARVRAMAGARFYRALGKVLGKSTDRRSDGG